MAEPAGPSSSVTIAAHNDIPIEAFSWRLANETARRLLGELLSERFSGRDELVGLPKMRAFLLYQENAYRIEVEIPIKLEELAAVGDD